MIALLLIACTPPVDYDLVGVFCGPEGRPHIAWIADEPTVVDITYTSPDEPFDLTSTVDTNGCTEVVVLAPDCIALSEVVVTVDGHDVIHQGPPCDADPSTWVMLEADGV